jgi:hypothetical protein
LPTINQPIEPVGSVIKTGEIKIVVLPKNIHIYLPKNTEDIAYIRGIQYSRWHKTQYCWIVPNFGQNLENLRNYFGERLTSIEEIQTETIAIKKTTTEPKTNYW